MKASRNKDHRSSPGHGASSAQGSVRTEDATTRLVAEKAGPSAAWWKNPQFLVFAGVFVAALIFAAYTKHAWEDYYITYRVSKNLATGHGLVYTIGERVHAFTSPLNVLIPAFFAVITGNASDELVLWLFRILSCGLLAGAAVILLEIARKESLGALATMLLLCMFGLDSKIIDFSINGQEVAFMMFFLALTLRALAVPSKQPTVMLGLALAGLMWTRPDGFIYFGALALGFLIFKAGRAVAESRLQLLRVFAGAGTLAIALYLPWLLWAWHYFGSPVPHTIIAKGAVFARPAFAGGGVHLAVLAKRLLCFPYNMFVEHGGAEALFMPPYALLGGWPIAEGLVSKVLAFLCAFYWCLPSGRPAGRAVSFALLIGLFYLSEVTPYVAPWYVPNCTVLAVFVLAQILQQVLESAGGFGVGRYLGVFSRAVAVGLVAGGCVTTLCVAYEMRVQQREIEEGTRTQIGLWLKENARSSRDSVFLESLGYIGYVSQLKMLDFPGLCAPEVVAAERKLQVDNEVSAASLIHELQPDWLVLRPNMIVMAEAVDPLLLSRHYEKVKRFDATDRVASYRWLPGRGYLQYDQVFIVYRRRSPEPSTRDAVLRAIDQYRRALAQKPELVEALANLAWILATDPDADLRNGSEAVELATRACKETSYRQVTLIETLAAAYAEAGQFDRAVDAMGTACSLDSSTGDTNQLSRDQEFLAQYKDHNACRVPR
jgi:hypothetical protein